MRAKKPGMYQSDELTFFGGKAKTLYRRNSIDITLFHSINDRQRPYCVSKGRRMNQLKLRVLILSLVLAMLTTIFCFQITREHETHNIQNVLTQQAHNPYQQRLLAPLAIEGLAIITGLPRADAEKIFYLLMLISVFYFFYWWLALTSPNNELAGIGLLLITFLVAWLPYIGFDALPPYGLRFPYDLPSLLFLMGLGAALLQKKWTAWYFFLIISMLNRETAVIMLIPLVYQTLKRTDHYPYRHLLTSILIVIGIKVSLSLLFPGSPVEVHFMANLTVLSGKRGWLPHISLMFSFASMWWLWLLGGYHSLRRKDWFTFFFLAAPALFGLVNNLAFAVIDEMRAYIDYAVFILPLALTEWHEVVNSIKNSNNSSKLS